MPIKTNRTLLLKQLKLLETLRGPKRMPSVLLLTLRLEEESSASLTKELLEPEKL
jgi:hypothetical protein